MYFIPHVFIHFNGIVFAFFQLTLSKQSIFLLIDSGENSNKRLDVYLCSRSQPEFLLSLQL